MDLQQCLVLTAASGAVLMDLKTGEIANGWIVILWLAGFLTNGMGHGMRGFYHFLSGRFFRSCYFSGYFISECSEQVISNFFSAWRLSRPGGNSEMYLSVIDLWRNSIYRHFHYLRKHSSASFKLTTYIKHIFLLKIQGKTTVPVPYRDGKWGMECIHFSVPILLAVLLWIGGFY